MITITLTIYNTYTVEFPPETGLVGQGGFKSVDAAATFARYTAPDLPIEVLDPWRIRS